MCSICLCLPLLPFIFLSCLSPLLYLTLFSLDSFILPYPLSYQTQVLLHILIWLHDSTFPILARSVVYQFCIRTSYGTDQSIIQAALSTGLKQDWASQPHVTLFFQQYLHISKVDVQIKRH